MKIEEPKVEYWKQEDPIDHVARVAHTCYHSQDKGHEANVKFYDNLIKSGHVSPLRHATYYFKGKFDMNNTNDKRCYEAINFYHTSPYIEIKFIEETGKNCHFVFFWVVTNGQFLYENEYRTQFLKLYQVSEEEFIKEQPEMRRFTFCLTTQISTTRELLRHSPQNVMEASTRYIRFGGKVEPSIVRPWWLHKCTDDATDEEYAYETDNEHPYLEACENSFKIYNQLLTNGLKAEDARGVLPLDTLSTLIMSGTVFEWEKILQMRLLDTTGRAHGNCHVICQLVYDELQKLGYKFNESNQLIYNGINLEK